MEESGGSGRQWIFWACICLQQPTHITPGVPSFAQDTTAFEGGPGQCMANDVRNSKGLEVPGPVSGIFPQGSATSAVS